MKNAQTKWDATFEDLPLFRRSRYRQIWESLPHRAQENVVHLLGDLLLAHVESNHKEGESHE